MRSPTTTNTGAETIPKHRIACVALCMTVLTHCALAAVPAKERRIAEVKGFSFEGGAVPSSWMSRPANALTLSSRHYKHGRQSLRWDWRRAARITATDLGTLEGGGSIGAIRAWVYNERPVKGALTFRFGTLGELRVERPRYEFMFNLDYNGWRALWVDLRNDAERGPGQGGNPVTAMTISAPDNAEFGSLYFDIVAFEDRMPSSRSGDFQAPFVNQDSDGFWQQTYRWGQEKPAEPLPAHVTSEEIEAFSVISDRYEDWFMGGGADLDDPLIKMRHDALNRFIKYGRDAFDRLGIERDGDRITGVPLFASVSPYGPKFSRHAIAECCIPLVMDYKRNGNAAARGMFFDLLDHLHDQGWAAGSANGSLDHELNRSSGYLQAVFLMRKELADSGRLEREVAAMNWYTEMGEIHEPSPLPGTTADRVISHLPYRLLSVLTMKDGPEKVRTMRSLVRSFDNAFRTTPGWAGLIKPDSLAFHHKGHYGSAYGAPALHSAAFLHYLLHGTPFQLSDTSRNNIREALLTLRAFSNKYDMPVAVCGRFPFRSYPLLEHVPAYAYMALAGDPIDEEMAGVFMRLWDPGSAFTRAGYAGQLLERSAYIHTLGELQLLRQLEGMGFEAEPSPEGHWAKNYGALSIHRREEWMATVRGHSKYVWDYEAHHRDEQQNIYGRYAAHAVLQIIGAGDPVSGAASGYVEEGWDWRRWPNATTIRLPLEALAVDRTRNFTDRPFVGGASHMSGNGVFAMDYHDTTFDTSFRAKSSVFFFDDTLVCLGSDIHNDDREHATETTLFQGVLQSKADPIWIDSTEPVTTFPLEMNSDGKSDYWLIDAYRNGYYVPGGQRIGLHRRTQDSRDHSGRRATAGDFATAWIDHGAAPQNAGYEYAIVVKTTPGDMDAFTRAPGYSVLRKDGGAHIVRHEGLGLVGYALFEPILGLGGGALKSAGAPCLVMARETRDTLELSVCDPDLRLMAKPVANMGDISFAMLYNESAGRHLKLVLRGRWTLDDPADGVRLEHPQANETVIDVFCKDGLTTHLSLHK